MPYEVRTPPLFSVAALTDGAASLLEVNTATQQEWPFVALTDGAATILTSTVSDEVDVPFVAISDSGTSLVTMKLYVPSDAGESFTRPDALQLEWLSEVLVSEIRQDTLAYEVGVLTGLNRAEDLRLDFDYFVPEVAHGEWNFSYYLALEIAYVGSEFTWAMGKLEDAYPDVSFAPKMGLLTNMWRPVGFAAKVNQWLMTDKVRRSFAWGQYVPTTKTNDTGFRYTVYDFDPLEFSFFSETGVNATQTSTLQAKNDCGVLSNLTLHWNMKVVQDQLTLAYKGFGAEYTAYLIGVPIYKDVSITYEVVEGERAYFNASWEQQATAQKLDMSMSYISSYQSFSELRTAYARHFSVVPREVGFAWTKERHLVKGVVLSCGHNVLGVAVLDLSLPYPVVGGVVANVPLNNTVLQGLEIALTLSSVRSGCVLHSPLNQLVSFALDLPMSFSPSVANGVTLDVGLRTEVVNGVVLNNELLTYTLVSRKSLLSAPLQSYDPIIRNSLYTLEDPTGEDVDGIDIESASIDADEGSFGWVGKFTLANVKDLKKFDTGSEFRITLGSEEFVFLTVAKTLTRNGVGNTVAELTGQSPGVQLTAPLSTPITKSWAESFLIYDLLNEMNPAVPMEVTIPNWAVPANRYGIADTQPMDVLTAVATAAGAIVDSKPDGTLRIRPEFPVHVHQWDIADPDLALEEDDDLYTTSLAESPERVYNRFRLMDAASTSGRDTLDYKDTKIGFGEVRAYPSPWRTNVELYSSSGAVAVSGVHEEYEDHEETIEIFNGVGRTSKPVVSVISISWEGIDLLGVVAGNDSTTVSSVHPTEKFSLLKIKYRTRSLVFDVMGPAGKQAQFLLRDV